MAGGIKGGERLERALAEIAARVGTKATLKVGFLADATYPDGTSVAAVAAIQNFGAPKAKIPATHFFDGMVKAKDGDWGPMLAASLKLTNYDVTASLNQVGFVIEGELRQAIVDVDGPDLSPITLMLRKMKSADQSLIITGKVVGEAAARVAAGESSAGVSTKRLIDSGYMLSRVDHEVTG